MYWFSVCFPTLFCYCRDVLLWYFNTDWICFNIYPIYTYFSFTSRKLSILSDYELLWLLTSVSALFKAETIQCSTIEGEEVGKDILTSCTVECLMRDGCYMVSFLPEGGSTELGICVLQLTSGGQMTQYDNTAAWQHNAMSAGRKCNMLVWKLNYEWKIITCVWNNLALQFG